MKNRVLGFLGLAAFLFAPALGFAQQATGGATVSQQAQHYDAATNVSATATAVNATQAAGTVTITPPSGQYVYFTSLLAGACQDGTASISGIQLNFTSTNLSGWTEETSTLSAATITTNPFVNMCAWGPNTIAFSPLRSATPGVAVTIVPPAQTAHMSFPIIATYYFSP